VASTEILTGDPQAVKRWSNRLYVEAIGSTFIKRFMGSSKSSILQVHTDLSKAAGDEVKYDLLPQIYGFGRQGDAQLKGNEKALAYFQDSMKIDQNREGITWGRMTQQRTLHDIMDDSTAVLGKYFGRVFDQLMFAHLCGAAGTAGAGTAVDGPLLTVDMAGGTGIGVNALVAPDAGHSIVAGAAFSADNFRKLREKAQLAEPIVQPTMVDGEPKYAVVLRPEAITSLKNETGPTKWKEVQARASDRGASNPIYTGALGEFDGCVLHESIYLPRDTGGTQLNYGVLLGAQAGSIAFGRDYKSLGSKASEGGGDMFSFFDDVDDYGNQIGISGAVIFGIKKNRFNSKDYGVIRISTTENPQ
jgi:N4-gp56 family major capsid protein